MWREERRPVVTFVVTVTLVRLVIITLCPKLKVKIKDVFICVKTLKWL